MFVAMSHRRKCICNFSFIYTYKSWPCLKMKDLNDNSIHRPDVRRKEMIFLYRTVQVVRFLKGNATHHRNVLFLCSIVGYVNVHHCFPKPKIRDKTNAFLLPWNGGWICSHETLSWVVKSDVYIVVLLMDIEQTLNIIWYFVINHLSFHVFK